MAHTKVNPLDLPHLPKELLHLIAIHLVFASASPPPPPPPLLGNSHDKPSTITPRRDSGVSASSSSASNRIELLMEMPPTAALTPGPIAEDPLMVPHPKALIPLMLVSREIYAALRFNGNERLYQRLYLATFDSDAVLRRYGKGRKEKSQSNGHASSEKQDTAMEREEDGMIPSVQRMKPVSTRWPSFGAEISLTSVNRKSIDHSMHLLVDPLPLANEYRERWLAIKQIRRCGEEMTLEVKGVFGFEDVVRDLWTTWWMVIENDGRNKRLLTEYANIYNLILVHYHNVFIKQSLEPGYPSDTIDKMLVGNIAYQLRLGRDRETESEEMDKLLFVNRPFVFACHKYSTHIAPWIFRVLPLTAYARDSTELNLLKEENPFMDDLTPRKQAVETERFGKLWDVVMLSTSEMGSIGFMGLLDRHPELLALVKNPDAPTMSRAGTYIPPSSPLALANSSARPMIGTNSSYFPLQEPGPSYLNTTPSQMYDPDFVRSLSCTSPVDAPGLPLLFYRHRFEGLWQGKYVYFDYPAYQSALAGNIRSIYDGAFGEQEQEMFLEETVINVRVDQVGGSGSPLLAGFQPSELINEAWKTQPGTVEERGWELCRDENAPDRPGWTKEIIITGHGRSAWGEFSVTGRIRSWDGLMTIVVNYADSHPTGKWHFRGYVHAGDVISGRWRETFTKENMRGYEGPWAVYKVDGPVYRESQQQKATLSQDASMPIPPTADPRQQGPVILPAMSIPVYRPAQPARLMSDVPPISLEYVEPRSHDSRSHVPPRPWGRAPPPPQGLRLHPSLSFSPSPPQSQHQLNILPPIIDPTLVEDKRLLSPGGRYHDHSAVSDMWSRSLASGGTKRRSQEMGDRKMSEDEESMRSVKRPWEDDERPFRFDE